MIGLFDELATLAQSAVRSVPRIVQGSIPSVQLSPLWRVRERRTPVLEIIRPFAFSTCLWL